MSMILADNGPSLMKILAVYLVGKCTAIFSLTAGMDVDNSVDSGEIPCHYSCRFGQYFQWVGMQLVSAFRRSNVNDFGR